MTRPKSLYLSYQHFLGKKWLLPAGVLMFLLGLSYCFHFDSVQTPFTLSSDVAPYHFQDALDRLFSGIATISFFVPPKFEKSPQTGIAEWENFKDDEFAARHHKKRSLYIFPASSTIASFHIDRAFNKSFSLFGSTTFGSYRALDSAVLRGYPPDAILADSGTIRTINHALEKKKGFRKLEYKVIAAGQAVLSQNSPFALLFLDTGDASIKVEESVLGVIPFMDLQSMEKFVIRQLTVQPAKVLYIKTIDELLQSLREDHIQAMFLETRHITHISKRTKMKFKRLDVSNNQRAIEMVLAIENTNDIKRWQKMIQKFPPLINDALGVEQWNIK